MSKCIRLCAYSLAAIVVLVAVPLFLYFQWDTAASLPIPPRQAAGLEAVRHIGLFMEFLLDSALARTGNLWASAIGWLKGFFGGGACSGGELEKAFDIALASYGISAVFYTFFLERSGRKHRGFLKREFISPALTVMFVFQVAYFAAICLIIANGVPAARAFTHYILTLHLSVSLVIVSYAICFGLEIILDVTIRLRIRSCAAKLAALGRKKRRLAKDPAAPDRRVDRVCRQAGRMDDRLFSMLANVAYDAGNRYGKQSMKLDAGFMAMVEELIRLICRREALADYKCYYCFYHLSECLHCGYLDKLRQTDRENPGSVDILLAFFEQVYRAVLGPQGGDGGESRKLHMLSGMACYAMDALSDQALKAYLARMLDTYQAVNRGPRAGAARPDGASSRATPDAGEALRPAELFSRMIYTLYGKLYYGIAVNRFPANDILAKALPLMVNYPPSAYRASMKPDLISHWQIWNKMNKAQPMRSAAELNRLAAAIASKYSAERVAPDKRDSVGMLLFGIQRGRRPT